MLVTFGPDVRWLTGFTGSSGVVVLRGGRAALCTDGRYTTQARAEAPDVRVLVKEKRSALSLAVAWLLARGVRRCAFDARQTTVTTLEGMRKALPEELGAARRGFFLATEGLVAGLREQKDAGEAKRMRRAAALGCALFEGVLQHMVPGATEIGVAQEQEYAPRGSGAEAMTFDTNVSSG